MRARLSALTLLTTFALAVTTLGAASTAPAEPGRGTPRYPLTVGAAEPIHSFVHTGESWGAPDPTSVADGTGVVTIVWSENGLRAAQRDTSGHWSAPATLAYCAAGDLDCFIPDYALVVDGAGTVTAFWAAWGSPVTRLYAASLPRGGTWSSPQLVASTRRDPTLGQPSISAGYDGTLLVAYENRLRDKGKVVTTVYRPPGATWATARRHSFADAQTPVTGLSDHGVAVVVARRLRSAATQMIGYRYRPGAGWSRRHAIGASMDDDRAPYNLAVGHRGGAVVAWPAPDLSVRARIMNRHGAWGRVHRLSWPGVLQLEAVGAEMEGRPTVIWGTRRAAIRSATKMSGRPWQVATAYPRNTGLFAAMNVNRIGDIAIMWQKWPSSETYMYAGLYSVGRGWSAGVKIPVVFGDISIAGTVSVLPDGSAMVVSFSEDYGGSETTTIFGLLGWTVSPGTAG